ncbi:MAG TPA: TonB-dependent receptor, partial [Halieaceae bacterium]|nr:TonB-dependent receptor [Halieaceae bacterium]
GFVGTVTNAGQAEISGIEVEGNVLLTEHFSVQLAMSLLDAEIKEWLLNGVNVADQRAVQNTPEEMLYLGLTYTTDFAAGDLTAKLNWSYKGDITQFEAPVPVIDQEAYDVINASLVWMSSDEQWLVGLHGKNLGDEEIKTAGYCFGEGGCPSSLGIENNTTVFYAPPRTLTATVEYRF